MFLRSFSLAIQARVQLQKAYSAVVEYFGFWSLDNTDDYYASLEDDEPYGSLTE